eukprot:6200757-Pleurochrysis_carterae.AAC.1
MRNGRKAEDSSSCGNLVDAVGLANLADLATFGDLGDLGDLVLLLLRSRLLRVFAPPTMASSACSSACRSSACSASVATAESWQKSLARYRLKGSSHTSSSADTTRSNESSWLHACDPDPQGQQQAGEQGRLQRRHAARSTLRENSEKRRSRRG